MKKESLLFNSFLDAIQMLVSIVVPVALTLKSYLILQHPSEDVRLTLFLSGVCIIISYIIKFSKVGKLQKVEISIAILSLIASVSLSLLSQYSEFFNSFDIASIITFGVGCIPIFLEMLFSLFVIDFNLGPSDV